MKKLLFLFCIPLLAHAWGPFQATSMKKVQGMDWSWSLKTNKPSISLQLDCQSFIHQFHQFENGHAALSIVLEEEDCNRAAQALKSCFPFPGKACVSGNTLPEIKCGKCQ